MRNINIEDSLRDLPFVHTNVPISNNSLFRGQKLNTSEGINSEIDFRFEIAGLKFGVQLDSIYQNTDDAVTTYASYNFDLLNLKNSIMYSRRYMTNSKTDTEEISLITEYLRDIEGPTYQNYLSYDLNSEEIIDIVSVSLDLVGFKGKVSYGYNNLKDSSFLIYGLGITGKSVINFFNKNQFKNYKVWDDVNKSLYNQKRPSNLNKALVMKNPSARIV